MKFIRSVLFCFCLLSGGLLFAQSHVGDWKIDVESPDGEVIPTKVSYTADGAYMIDLGMDDVIDIKGEYTIEGDKMTMQDKEGAMMCTEKGIYTFKVDGASMKLERVEDDCAGRGDAASREFTKM
ncbi:MAG: hypothetical protein AAF694_28230 [Bacteroidota bacterium]